MPVEDNLRKSLEEKAKEPLLYISEVLRLVKNLGYKNATSTIVKRIIERQGGRVYEPESYFPSSKDGVMPRMCSYTAVRDLLGHLESINLIAPLNGLSLEYMIENGYHTTNCSSLQPVIRKPSKRGPDNPER